jgi:hypothetical protein
MGVRSILLGLCIARGAMIAQTSGICGQSGQKPPCVDQPTVGDTWVSGQIPKPGAGAGPRTVAVQVNGNSVESLSITNTELTTFKVSVPALTISDKIEVKINDTTLKPAVAEAPTDNTSSLYTLGLVGVNATGASSSGPSQQYFVSFDLLTPIAWGRKFEEREKRYPLEHRWWVWFNPRIASLPSPNTSALSTIGSASALSAGAGGQTIGAITQSFEFQGGIEYYFAKDAWHGAQFGFGNSWARTTVSLIAGGGSVTPFNTSAPTAEYSLNNNLAQNFNQTPSLASAYPQLAAALCNYGFTGGGGVTCPTKAPAAKPTSVAFVLPNRSRFYRDYYAGLRLRTFYLNGRSCPDPSSGEFPSGCKLQNTFPGTLDLRFGQDESVTQHLKGVVMTLSATYPLPGTGGTVRIFGSAYLGLRRNKTSSPLVLVPASTVSTLDQPTVVVQTIQPTDQDYYRLGLGVDLVPLIAKWATATKK